MIIGTSSFWLERIKDIDKSLIECVERVWPSVIARLRNTEREDNITQRLVDVLRADRAICNIGFLVPHHKLREADCAGDYTTKGILDMALFVDQDYERYIAYECKRLNIVNRDGKRTGSLAGAYVEEGVVRYATAKYSEKLPYGCMIGYVMDGDRKFALQQLISALKKRKKLVKLESDEIEAKDGYFTEFETSHRRNTGNSEIEVRHRLFSMAV
ncbi:MAG TPA: hypothetical protein ENJ84_13565 [Gammaproteobacteria bacterium]|nr:hypothetical protein [Gammaproteobacteria bacterium]